MLYKQRILAFTMLFIMLASNSFVVLGVSISNNGTISGEISGEISGDLAGETPGDISGELSGESYLGSVAQSSSISTYKNTAITSTLRSEIASGETNLVYVIETQPSHGTLLYEDNKTATFTYTPDRDFLGTDTFSFKLTNGTLSSNVAMVTITVTENAEPIIPFYYVDMQNHWANYSASHLAARGLIIGEEIGSRYYFRPNTLVTRQDFILYLLSITESNEDSNIEIPNVTFADETLYPDWLLEAAKLAYAKGIIKGSAVGNKLYLNLYSNITRAEATVMMNNTLNVTASTTDVTYSDKNDIPAWALSAVKTLTSYKIIQGDGTHFRPNSIITKAEAIEMTFKLLKQIESDEWNGATGSGDVK